MKITTTVLKGKAYGIMEIYQGEMLGSFKYDDVKQAVLEFENIIKKAIKDGCIEDKLQNALDVHKQIFGDWKE